MRWVLHAALPFLTACFHPNYDHLACSPLGECPSGFTCVNDACVLAGEPGDASEVSIGGDASDQTDALGSAVSFCGPITGLVACYEFEGNANDGSGNGLDATTTNVVFAPGRVGQAMALGSNSSATVNPSMLFDDVSRFTIEAWIQPAARSSTSTSVILTVPGDYVFEINDNELLDCAIAGVGAIVQAQVSTTETVPIGQWTHCACTYDGTAVKIYVNGAIAATGGGGSGAINNEANGMGLAGYESQFPLLGLIDQLRLFNVARSAAEICTDAGGISCPP